MQRWEYQVTRLNIEPTPARRDPSAPGADAPQAPRAGGEGPAAGKSGAGPVFSEAYLRQEFPSFYNEQAGGSPAKPSEDAGQQLQGFLNAQGQLGWDLIGLQHAGPHTFIIFKRPMAPESPVADTQAEQLKLTLDLANRALAILERQAP